MSASLKQAYENIRECLKELDVCFSPYARQLYSEKRKIEDENKRLQQQKEMLLTRAGVSLSERISNIQDNLSAIYRDMQQKGMQLDVDMASIKQKIDQIGKTIENDKSLKKKLELVLQKLENRKRDIQQNIDERGIIIKIVKFIFGDVEKTNLMGVEDDIRKKYKEKGDIQADCDRLQQDLLKNQNDLKEQQKLLENLCRQLDLKNQQLASIQEAMTLEDTIEKNLLQVKALELKIRDLDNKANEKHKLCLTRLDASCKEIRALQPQLADCTVSLFGCSREYPDMFALGRLRLFSNDYSKQWKGYLPRLLPFPLKHGLCFDNQNGAREWINAFLLRSFQCLPCNHLSITVVDPIQLGKSLPAYQLLLKNKRPFIDQRFLTRSDEIEEMLNQQLMYVEKLIQKTFVGGIENWQQYNHQNADNQLDYRLLVLFDVPEQLTDKANLYLARLLEHGPTCGVFPLLVCDDDRFDERRNRELLEAIEKYTWKNDGIYAHTSMVKNLQYLKHSEEMENIPDAKITEAIMEGLLPTFAQLSGFSMSMEKLWGEEVMWSSCSKDGLTANIGWTVVGNKPVPFTIGGVNTQHHTLLGGKTGSGKSNLLHILIHSLCHRYSPNELNLYLLDYKQAVEFNIYANPYIPHARLVATASDVNYGLAVLNFLVQEIQRRSVLFKEALVRDYSEFRNLHNDVLPRILLIIDEFQMLFSEEFDTAQDIENDLDVLLKLGRAYGIHLLLATQTLKGLQNHSISKLISQMGCRIALSCSEDDSAVLLGSANWEAARLKSPPEGIINTENGSKTANIRFNIPLADGEKRLSFQKIMLKKAEEAKMRLERRIFNGNILPAMPSEDHFRIEAMSGDIPFMLGEKLDFEAAPFIANLKKENLLIVGYDPNLRNGLAASMMLSIKAMQGNKSVLIYQSHEDENIFSEFMGLPFVQGKDSSWDGLDLEEFAALADVGEKFLFIDSLDFGRIFHPAPIGMLRKPNQPPSPSEVLRKLMDSTVSSHVHVILFVENYRRFATSAKDMLNAIDLRIGFGLDDDDAGNFVSSGGYGKFKGLKQPNKAVFVNRKLNQMTFIRPFNMN